MADGICYNTIMLELSQFVTDIGKMGAEARKRGERVASQMQTALGQARLETDAWNVARAKIAGANVSWLAADCGDETPGSVMPLPHPAPAVYTALATDGSQIPLDRHAVTPCYLLNVGEIALHYGTNERPRLTSQATLHYKDEDIASEDGVPLSEKIVANRRLLAESDALSKLIESHADRHALALVDDPLIVWTPAGEREDEQQKVIAEFCKLLDVGRKVGVPIAGYVSRPGHKDVVGALRLTLCEDGCAHGPQDLCGQLSRLTDAALFAALLQKPGDRSPIFGSNARSLDLYPAVHRVAFFYMNAGAEIARVEIPQWVAEDVDLRDRVHVLTFDQCRKGQGYPGALSEAHERAVVRGPERDAFFQLVENAFVRERIPALHTRKALAKRTRLL